jgi:hypothetical protein
VDGGSVLPAINTRKSNNSKQSNLAAHARDTHSTGLSAPYGVFLQRIRCRKKIKPQRLAEPVSAPEGPAPPDRPAKPAATAVDSIRSGVGIRTLVAAFEKFKQYLRAVGYTGTNEQIDIDTPQKMKVNMLSYYDRDKRLLVIDRRYANDPLLMYHEFMRYVLDPSGGAKGPESRLWSYLAIESGLALYFPSSFLNNAKPSPIRTLAGISQEPARLPSSARTMFPLRPTVRKCGAARFGKSDRNWGRINPTSCCSMGGVHFGLTKSHLIAAQHLSESFSTSTKRIKRRFERFLPAVDWHQQTELKPCTAPRRAPTL